MRRAARRGGRGPRGASRPGTQGPAGSARGGHTAGGGQLPPAKSVPAGCSFGGKVYALDETWHPDLGEPFGVMRCVLCACEAVSGPNGRGRGPRGSGTARVLGRRRDSELPKKEKSVCTYLGYFSDGGSGEEAPPSSLRCCLLLITHCVAGSLPTPFRLSLA